MDSLKKRLTIGLYDVCESKMSWAFTWSLGPNFLFTPPTLFFPSLHPPSPSILSLSSSFSPPTFFFSSLSTPPYSAPVSLLYTPFHSSSSHLYSFLHLPIVELKLLNSTQSSSHFFFFSGKFFLVCSFRFLFMLANYCVFRLHTKKTYFCCVYEILLFLLILIFVYVMQIQHVACTIW